MTFISDILLVFAAMAACFYCYVLAKRLRKLSDLDKGVGGAIALLAIQVDELTRALKSSEKAAQDAANLLENKAQQADLAAQRLELLIASLHDLPTPPLEEAQQIDPFFSHARRKETA